MARSGRTRTPRKWQDKCSRKRSPAAKSANKPQSSSALLSRPTSPQAKFSQSQLPVRIISLKIRPQAVRQLSEDVHRQCPGSSLSAGIHGDVEGDPLRHWDVLGMHVAAKSQGQVASSCHCLPAPSLKSGVAQINCQPFRVRMPSIRSGATAAPGMDLGTEKKER